MNSSRKWRVLTALALALPGIAAAHGFSVGILINPGRLTADGLVCSYIDDSVAHSRLPVNGVIETYNGSDYSRLYPKDTSCPKKIVFEYGTYHMGHATETLFASGQRNHICQYLLDEDTLQAWRSRHPGSATPVFEDVYPATTKCPVPADDHTPLDSLTPAQHEAALLLERQNDCIGEIESPIYQACLNGETPMGFNVASMKLKELEEFKATRHWTGGVKVELGPDATKVCAGVLGGSPLGRYVSVTKLDGASSYADQYLCIDRITGQISVGTMYTKIMPEPLAVWRAHHGALTYRGAVLNPLLPKPDTAKSQSQNEGETLAPKFGAITPAIPTSVAPADRTAAASATGGGHTSCFDLAKHEPRVLQGKLMSAVFAGPPNYADVRKGDSPETAYVLKLESSICISDSGGDGASGDVSLVQLYPRDGDSAIEAQMRALLGFDVKVEFTATQAAMTGHDHEPLVAGVGRITLAGDVAGRALTPRILTQDPFDAAAEGGSAATTVRAFYEALGVGNGPAANLLVVPEKRASGAYAADRISQFYGPMVEPLHLVSLSTQSASEYLVSYHFKAGARACDGRAVVSITQREGLNLIDKIHPLDGC